jgi:excisionase family DNA binding protein
MNLIDELRCGDAFLTTKEVMGLLKLNRNTLCKWVRCGKVCAIRIGNAYVFDPRALAEFLLTRQTRSNSVRRTA